MAIAMLSPVNKSSKINFGSNLDGNIYLKGRPEEVKELVKLAEIDSRYHDGMPDILDKTSADDTMVLKTYPGQLYEYGVFRLSQLAKKYGTDVEIREKLNIQA